MAKIPEYFATGQMETSRLPRAPAGISYTGQGLEAEALEGIGRALGKGGQILAGIETEKQRARDNVTLAEMKGLLDDFEYESMPDLTQIEKIEDFKKLEEKYGKDWKNIIKKISKGQNRRVADQFNIYTELHWDTARKNYHNKSWPLEQDYAVASLNKEWSKRLKEHINNPIKLKKELQLLIEQYDTYLKPTDKQKLEAGIDEEIAIYQKQDTLNKLHQAAKSLPYKEAIGFLNDIEGITSAERNDLIKRRERQEEIATATTNRKVRWDVLRKVTENPQSVTDEWLESLVKPDSLTWDDAEEFKKIRDDETEPLKTPRAQLYFNSLDALYDARETDDEQRMKYDIANEKLVQFFKDNPKATAQQAAKFYEELVEPEINKFWDLSGLFWKQRLPFEILKKRKPKESKSPYPEYPDAFEENGVWKVIRDGKKYRIE